MKSGGSSRDIYTGVVESARTVNTSEGIFCLCVGGRRRRRRREPDVVEKYLVEEVVSERRVIGSSNPTRVGNSIIFSLFMKLF